MLRQALIAGGGIGGLAAALAASRAGWDVRLFERASAFSEVGAGIQLGPNVVKVLQGWGLADALQIVAAFPERLQVRSAVSGQLLGELPLGAAIAGVMARLTSPCTARICTPAAGGRAAACRREAAPEPAACSPSARPRKPSRCRPTTAPALKAMP
jgi:hypothetical protein